MLSEILFNFKDANWYYILAISLQLAGALLLLVRYWGDSETKVIQMYSKPKSVMVNKGKFKLEKDELRECSYEIYMNRISFIYIIMGYIIGIFGELTIKCKGSIAFAIIVGMLFFIFAGIIISKIFAMLIYRNDIIKNSDEYKNLNISFTDLG